MLNTVIKFVLNLISGLFNKIKIAKWETKQREDVSKAERDIRDAVDNVDPVKDVDVIDGKIKDRPDDDAFNNKNWNN